MALNSSVEEVAPETGVSFFCHWNVGVGSAFTVTDIVNADPLVTAADWGGLVISGGNREVSLGATAIV